MLGAKFLKFTEKSGKISLNFFEIAHWRSWQNFSKSEQEKLRGKLDSANFNFRLPQGTAFARHPIVKKSSSRRQANTTLGRGRTGSRQPFENATSPWTSVAGGDPRTGAACRGAWQPPRSSRLCGGFFPPKCGWGSQGRARGFALPEPRPCRHEAFLLVSP